MAVRMMVIVSMIGLIIIFARLLASYKRRIVTKRLLIIIKIMNISCR